MLDLINKGTAIEILSETQFTTVLLGPDMINYVENNVIDPTKLLRPGTVVNWKYHFINGGSLEITVTVP